MNALAQSAEVEIYRGNKLMVLFYLMGFFHVFFKMFFAGCLMKIMGFDGFDI